MSPRKDLDVRDDQSLVTVATYVDRFEAEVARSALEAAGISVTLSADDCGHMRPSLWLAGVRLLVLSDESERAAEILSRSRA